MRRHVWSLTARQCRAIESRIRAQLADALERAIAAAHPADARRILAAALRELGPKPAPADLRREDARFWSRELELSDGPARATRPGLAMEGAHVGP